MEPFSVFLTSLLSFLTFLLIRHLRTKADTGGNRALPPGTFGLPIIGQTLQFLAANRSGVSEKFVLAGVNKHSSPVFKTSLFGEKFAVFHGAAANKYIFANDGKLLTRWRPGTVNKLFPSTRFVSVENDARKGRRFVSLFFRFDGARQSLLATVDSASREHFRAHWAGTEEVRVYPLVKLHTFQLACRLFMSVDEADRVLRLLHDFDILTGGLLSVPVNFPGTRFRRAIKAAEVLRREIGSIIAERREALAAGAASPAQDVLSHMLGGEDEEDMTEVEIADKILAFLIASHESTSAVITFAMRYLAEMPHLYARVLKEQMEISSSMESRENLCWEDVQKMSFTWNFVCEVMRHTTIFQGSFREATADLKLEDFVIPKGWKVYFSIGSTHKNPEYFLEPERFDPSRFEDQKGDIIPNTYVPFGGGSLMCPGKEYARVEILIFLHHLLNMFRWEALDPNEKIKYEMTPLPENGFPIRLSPSKIRT